MVSTTKKSMAAISLAWFFKNVRQVCDGGLRARDLYLRTVAMTMS